MTTYEQKRTEEKIPQTRTIETRPIEVVKDNYSGRMLIAKDKIYFYEHPDLAATTKSAWLVEGDKAIIEKTENGFGYVEYINYEGVITKGWILLSQTMIDVPDSEVVNKIAIEKISFANKKCSYCIASGNNYQLVKNIEQSRIEKMKNFFGGIVSDDANGWMSRKKTMEKDESDEFIWNVEHIYQNRHVISITYSWYSYSYPSAHGDGGEITFSYDKSTGRLIDMNDLVIDLNQLLSVAEKQFRKTYKIPDGANLNEYECFDFKNNRFQMAEKFGFSTKGIRFYYDEYEVCCHAGGRPNFTIPYSQLNGIVRYLKN
jgi:hypothetical protein